MTDLQHCAFFDFLVQADKHIIKNKKLIAELERKLFRILSVENSSQNSFRQKITAVKKHLIAELDSYDTTELSESTS